ncbi:hypothetical protein HELRODRAFT_73535 [Helobdella robusta]|uniref:Thioredoxin domain-containing protein 9 n=1 Tax=Helobdella robusta TaxID=6412 RepID=T1G1F4_HELRO|nr:hypothetical protein HELRODRAFT_73535 [Helobdella robusta]ESO09210.1 hypothetical protein HELRODRAFT_73535 [Helobdella robusta]
MGDYLEKQVLAAAQILEQQVDSKLEELDNLKSDSDFEELRKKRLLNLKKSQVQKEEWLKLGHGNYTEIHDEPEFFDVCKKSKNVVCHFYRPTTSHCQIVDKHLEILSSSHIECKFIKINAERCHFLVERLRIKVIPTICLIKETKSVDYIVGFDDLGGRTDFATSRLEWRIAQAGILNYAGDLLHPPTEVQTKKKSKLKTIYSSKNEEDSDSDCDD